MKAKAQPNTTGANTLNRRKFLKLTGAGVFVFLSLGPRSLLPDAADAAQALPTDFNAFLQIGANGRVSCYTGKVEMGQGVVTSLAQLLADELEVPIQNVDMVMGDTELCPWDAGTFGSRSIRIFGPALRAAAAEAKAVLLELASEQLKVPKDKLTALNGEVIETDKPTNRISYAALSGGKRIERHISDPVQVKHFTKYRYIGKSMLRADALAKVTGKAKYAADSQMIGLLHARILRPPMHGAKLVSVDLNEAKKVPGIHVVELDDLIAVLHPLPNVAEQALGMIQAKYDTPASDLTHENIFEHLLKSAPQGELLDSGGDMDAGKKAATQNIEATWLNSYVAHAPIEPHTATAHIKDGKAIIVASTQTPFRAQEQAAQAMGLAVEDVRIKTPYVGGGFGGKSANQQIVEAARLCKHLGRSVQVAWTREEEFFYDTFRPAAVAKIHSGVDDKGRIQHWDYQVFFAGDRGAAQFYDIPNHRTLSRGGLMHGPDSSPHPFAVGYWRAPGNNTNTFARECQIDMMAAQARIDPLEFRLNNLTDRRMRHILQTATQQFGWVKAPAPTGLGQGRGRGLACGIDAGTYVAAAAEVEVDEYTGAIVVTRVVLAQNMGLCVNPEGAAIQIEGCVTMGMGYALTEEVHFKGGDIYDSNFDTYDIPRFSWLPKIEHVIVKAPMSKPEGGGEPAIIVMGAVLANAVYDACGARLFQLPMTPDRVKKALELAQKQRQ